MHFTIGSSRATFVMCIGSSSVMMDGLAARGFQKLRFCTKCKKTKGKRLLVKQLMVVLMNVPGGA